MSELLTEIQRRVDEGQKFNGYESVADTYYICLGPITDFLVLADATRPETADLIVDALRQMHGQELALCKLADSVGGDDDDYE
jgi:hypothetical protein